MPVTDTVTSAQLKTIFIAPGNSQCRIYALPYPLKQNQHPTQIREELRKDWTEIGLLNWELKLVHLQKEYHSLKDDIEGLMGGTFFTVMRTDTGYQFMDRTQVSQILSSI